MPLRTFALLIVVLGISPATLAQQSVENSQFQIRFSTAGVSSLKHVHDKYDTDYIASGEALGNVVIRYRTRGDHDWKLASAARIDENHSAGPSLLVPMDGDKVSVELARLPSVAK